MGEKYQHHPTSYNIFFGCFWVYCISSIWICTGQTLWLQKQDRTCLDSFNRHTAGHGSRCRKLRYTDSIRISEIVFCSFVLVSGWGLCCGRLNVSGLRKDKGPVLNMWVWTAVRPLHPCCLRTETVALPEAGTRWRLRDLIHFVCRTDHWYWMGGLYESWISHCGDWSVLYSLWCILEIDLRQLDECLKLEAFWRPSAVCQAVWWVWCRPWCALATTRRVLEEQSISVTLLL